MERPHEGAPAYWQRGFPPDVLTVIFAAFDDAWVELAPDVGADLASIDAAQVSLATIILSLATAGPIDRLGLKSAAMDVFRFKHRLT